LTQEYGLPQAAKGQDYGDQGPQIQEGLAFPKNSLTEDVGRILDSLQIRRRFRFPGFSLSGIADGTDKAFYGIWKEAEAKKVFQFIQGPFAMGEDQDAARNGADLDELDIRQGADFFFDQFSQFRIANEGGRTVTAASFQDRNAGKMGHSSGRLCRLDLRPAYTGGRSCGSRFALLIVEHIVYGFANRRAHHKT
jgi:hypothetical protein